MALQEECTKCRMYKKGTSKMRCSFYSSEVKFDDKPCSHYSEKKVPQDVNPQPQKTDEIVTDSVYSGAYNQNRISTEDSPFEQFIKNHKWIIFLCVIFLFHAVSTDLGVGVSAEDIGNLKGKARGYMAILFPGEIFVTLELTILTALMNFVFVFLYYKMKNLTKNHKAMFLTINNVGHGNAIDGLFFYQIILAVTVLANIVVSLFDYEWQMMDLLSFVAMLFVIVDLFTLGIRLRKLKLKSFGTWMFLYGTVWFVQLVDTVIEWTGGTFFGNSYTIYMVISLFEILTAIMFYVKTDYELAPTLENIEPEC